MRNVQRFSLAAIFFFLAIFSLGAAPENIIWFDSAATNFIASSPVGSGRLGAMMFGGVDEDRIVLNESSVWSGSRQDADRPDAAKALPEIRKLLLEGKNYEAQQLVDASFTCKGPGSAGKAYGCYQVLGNLHLSFSGVDRSLPVTNYRRELDLDTAVARVQFTRGAVKFEREIFASAPDEVIVMRLTADHPGSISFAATLDRPERFDTKGDGPRGLIMTGQMESGTSEKGLTYVSRLRALNKGGEISVDGNILRVANADEVVLLIAAATDYQGFAGRQTKDPFAATEHDLNSAGEKSYKWLRQAHVADHQKYYRRVELQISGGDADTSSMPTPKRIEAMKNGSDDPGLAVLYFNFGRYLLISSSRPGGFPPNLQGIWAEEIQTPWNGDWHLDVNVQMNYWPAECCNLSDLHDPLFQLISSLQEPGAKTAKAYYDAGGWVAHVITNPWGFTSPGESASWGASTGGSAWLCEHLFDHYRFTLDKNFLRWAYPIMKGSARFYADMLIEDPAHHWLVIAPVNSPENSFILPDGREAAISLGSTVSSQQTRYLFDACIKSSEILGEDADFRHELIRKRDRLAPNLIGSDGRLLEWLQEYKEADPHHRHVSHMWGLYPGDEISARETPALAEAAKKSLITRGDDGLGWSLAYKIALWARLGEGNHAWTLVKNALAPVTTQEIRYDKGGGVYPNLFDACPPFQIDGNFGTTAGIAEMLLQSQDEDGVISLLPALPDDWKSGSVKGLRARGDYEVDLAWENHRLTQVSIRAHANGVCRVVYRGKTARFKMRKGQLLALNGNLER
jgi:alpha-L-fucosidase 2